MNAADLILNTLIDHKERTMIDTENSLWEFVLRNRGSMGLRAAAKEIGISPTTLSRIESGHIPDRKTLDILCKWIGEEPARFTGLGQLRTGLRIQRKTSPQSYQALAKLIRIAGDKFSNIEPEGHK